MAGCHQAETEELSDALVKEHTKEMEECKLPMEKGNLMRLHGQALNKILQQEICQLKP